MKNYISSQEHPYFKTAQQRQILQVEGDGGNYWAAVTGSSSFPLLLLFLDAEQRCSFPYCPFFHVELIPAVRTPSGLPVMQRVELTKWSDEHALSFFICVFCCFYLFFILLLCDKSSRMIFCLEILNQWASDCKYKTPRCLTGESEIRGYGKSMRLQRDFDFKGGEGANYTLSKLLPVLSLFSIY